MSVALPCVLFVDDEERILRSLRMLFRGRCEILTTTSGREAIEWVRQRRVHVVVSDQRMPEIGGIEVLRAVAVHSPSTMRLLLTGYADLEAVTASVNDGEIYRFVDKPWDAQYLLNAVAQAAEAAEWAFEAAKRAAETPMVAMPLAASIAARIVVLDEDAALVQQIRAMLPAAVRVDHAPTLDHALGCFAENEIAVLVAQFSDRNGDIAGSLKHLKRLRPATLAVVVSPLRDSRRVIGLINEGQIFRFLLQPAPRELLRRALVAALDRHAELRASPALQRRHAVDAPSEPAGSLSGRLMQTWRRIRDAAVFQGA